LRSLLVSNNYPKGTAMNHFPIAASLTTAVEMCIITPEQAKPVAQAFLARDRYYPADVLAALRDLAEG
jgi:hypothetical protein